MRGEKRTFETEGEESGESQQPEQLETIVEAEQPLNTFTEVLVARLMISLKSTSPIKEIISESRFELTSDISGAIDQDLVLDNLNSESVVAYLGLQKPDELSYIFYVRFKKASDVAELNSSHPNLEVTRNICYEVYARKRDF